MSSRSLRALTELGGPRRVWKTVSADCHVGWRDAGLGTLLIRVRGFTVFICSRIKARDVR
jgi:hypothetical protein